MIIGPRRFWESDVDPIATYVTHLRHLTKSVTAKLVLRDRFGFSDSAAAATGRIVAAYVGHALEFHAASISAPFSIKPILQYYCYLNLAVGVIETYRPANYQARGTHGVHDLTYRVGSGRITAATPLVRASSGVIPLFHDVIAADSLHGRTFSLNDLITSLPFLSTELEEAFAIYQHEFHITPSVVEQYNPDGSVFRSKIVLKSARRPRDTTDPSLPTTAQISAAMPMLVVSYNLTHSTPSAHTYLSWTEWPDRSMCESAHRTVCRQLINFGGHHFRFYRWRFLPRRHLLPTATASLLFSFFLSSLYRYRARLAVRWQRSRLNILADTFVSESDAVLIPMFRNLLFADAA
jgi:hypothetical protein